MKTFWRLLVLDLKVYFRHPFAVAWLFPVVLLSLPLIWLEGRAIGRLSVDMVDEDRTAASTALLRAIDVALKQDRRLNVTQSSGERNPTSGPRAQIRIVVPRGFEAGMAGGHPPAVPVMDLDNDVDDGTNVVRIGKGIAELAIVQFVRRSLRGESRLSLPVAEPIGGHGPLSYLLPGYAVMMLYASCLFRFAVPIAGKRQSGVMKTFVQFPVPAITYIAVAVVSHIAVNFLIGGALYACAMLALGLPLPPSAAAFGLSVGLLLLGTLAFLSLGLLIATRTHSVGQAMLICNLIYYPFVFVSNVVVPDRVLPDWMVAIAGIFPLRSLADAVRLAVIDHLGARDFAGTVAFLAGWGALCLLLIRPRRLWYATQRDLVWFVTRRARRMLARLMIGRVPRPVSD
jgi:hypothetical protein